MCWARGAGCCVWLWRLAHGGILLVILIYPGEIICLMCGCMGLMCMRCCFRAKLITRGETFLRSSLLYVFQSMSHSGKRVGI